MSLKFDSLNSLETRVIYRMKRINACLIMKKKRKKTIIGLKSNLFLSWIIEKASVTDRCIHAFVICLFQF